MKIYFSAAIYHKDKFGRNYDAIIALLEKWGHSVQHQQITEHSLDFVLKQSETELKSYYESVSGWMKEADIIVIESSFPSTVNIGHEITLALTKGKPVVVLYQKDLRPILLLSINNPNLICVEYSLETLDDDLALAVEYLEGQMDVRFNLLISSRMNQYLKQISKEEKVSKSHFIRSLIRDHMKQNKTTADASDE